MKKGTGKGASVPENILKYLFLPLCLAPSPSMTSLQQTLEPSSHIYIFFYYSPSRVSMQSQPPSLSLPISSKSFLSHIPPSVPPSILLLLFYPLLPSLHLSVSLYLTIKFLSSHITYNCLSVALSCLVMQINGKE